MNSIFHTIINLLAQAHDLGLATVISRTGSAPRAMGARLVALPDGKLYGSVGGGLIEAEVLRRVPQVFEHHRAEVQEFVLTGTDVTQFDMLCGGRTEVLLEYVTAEPANLMFYRSVVAGWEQREVARLVTPLPVGLGQTVGHALVRPGGEVVRVGNGGLPEAGELAALAESARGRAPALILRGGTRFLVEPLVDPGTVYVLGAGHVGRQVALLCTQVGFRVVVGDDRPEYAQTDLFPTADLVVRLESFAQALPVQALDENSYVVIVTRGHVHDKAVLAQALRTAAGYIGMIGSRRKRDAIYAALLQEGFTADDLARVQAPIGLKIGAETPEELAVSIVGELIEARSRKAMNVGVS